MRKMTRRGFLRHAGEAGIAIGTSQLLSGCTAPLPVIPDTPTAEGARVAAVRGSNLAAMAREALDAFGGAGTFVKPGESVFIKPNFGALGMVKYNPITKGDSVKPEIVIAVAEECLRVGAGKVIIGDGGQAWTFFWEESHTLDGSTNLAGQPLQFTQKIEN